MAEASRQGIKMTTTTYKYFEALAFLCLIAFYLSFRAKLMKQLRAAASNVQRLEEKEEEEEEEIA